MTIWALVVFLWSLQCSASSLRFLHLFDDNVILILNEHGLHLITSDLVSVASLGLFALCFVMVYFGAYFWLSSSACVNFLSDVDHLLKLQFHEVEAWFSILVLWLWFIFGSLLFGIVGELFKIHVLTIQIMSRYFKLRIIVFGQIWFSWNTGMESLKRSSVGSTKFRKDIDTLRLFDLILRLSIGRILTMSLWRCFNFHWTFAVILTLSMNTSQSLALVHSQLLRCYPFSLSHSWSNHGRRLFLHSWKHKCFFNLSTSIPSFLDLSLIHHHHFTVLQVSLGTVFLVIKQLLSELFSWQLMKSGTRLTFIVFKICIIYGHLLIAAVGVSPLQLL
jgi:hypothetical protein